MKSAFACLALLSLSTASALEGEISAAAYPSLQEAVAANAGRMIFVPAGDHLIHGKIRLRGDRCGLYGPGRILSDNPQQCIIEIEGAADAEIRGLTLGRVQGRQESTQEGLLALGCDSLVIEGLRVENNRSPAASIALRDCKATRISHCRIRNYMRVTVDDRSASPNYGYAFACTDGTGISVRSSSGTWIEGCHIVEQTLLPTPEIKAAHRLGHFVKKNAKRGLLISEKTWQEGYTNNWQQGSGILVTSPEQTRQTRILNNHIENAAQGIDLHCDEVLVSGNLVINSFMGMKAMHGSRNVQICNNQFIRNSLWSIGLMPGAAAHPAAQGKAANADGGSLIANNLIVDFGRGDAAWIWGVENSPFKFDNGQEADDPPLRDVLIIGNQVTQQAEARYKYAVILAGGPTGPQDLEFVGNRLPPGSLGVSNRPLPQGKATEP